jgi:hypothetical protein
MKQSLTFILFLVFTSYVHAQTVVYLQKKDRTIIRIIEYYSGCGKIFGAADTFLMQLTNSGSTFTPTVEEVLSAERLLNLKYNSFVKSDERIKSLVGAEYKDFYSKFYRQYFGIRNESGEKIIFIQYLKCCHRNINRCFPGWKNKLSMPLDEDSCTATSNFTVNLTQQTISLF